MCSVDVHTCIPEFYLQPRLDYCIALLAAAELPKTGGPPSCTPPKTPNDILMRSARNNCLRFKSEPDSFLTTRLMEWSAAYRNKLGKVIVLL